MSVCKAFSRFIMVLTLTTWNPSAGTVFRPRSQLGCVGKTGQSLHHFSIVGEVEELWAGKMWAIVGKQCRLTLDLVAFAVLIWVFCMKIVDTAHCIRQIHIASMTGWIQGYRGTRPPERGRLSGLSSARDGRKRQRIEGIGWMGERQDWPITALFLDRRSRRGKLAYEILASVWLTALVEKTENARSVLYARWVVSFWCLGACNIGMVVAGGKWETVHCEDRVDVYWAIYINPLQFRI